MVKEFINNIEKIKTGTISGKIVWTKSGGKTYIWKTNDSQNRKINLVLQNLRDEFDRSDIIFRLWDVKEKSALFEIRTSAADDKTKKQVIDLYDFVKDNYLLGNSSILDDILKDI